MISTDAYLGTVRDRLVQDSCEVTERPIGPVHALVGYRSNVKALSKVHLFTAVAGVSEVNEAAIQDFSVRVSDYAREVQPAVVDLTEGRVHTFRGRRVWGAALAGYLRQKSVLYLPDPA
jgi:hypothetical protein